MASVEILNRLSIMPQLNGVVQRQELRNLEQRKIAFVGVISYILYARRGFPSSCFQLLQADHLHESLEEILAGEHGIPRFDPRHLENPNTRVFFRRAADLGLARFLQILKSDVLRMIESNDLAEFRINFQNSTTLGGNSLKEYFNITFTTHDDGTVELDVWRGGVGPQHLDMTGSGFVDLGIYLSGLVEWRDLVHWTLSMRPKAKVDAPVVGLWSNNGAAFDEANRGLRRQRNYCTERAGRLLIKPKPPKDAALAHPSQPSHTPERIVDTIEGAEFVDSSEILNASDSINDAGLAKNLQQSDDFISGEDPQVSNCSKQQPLQKFSLADTLEPLQDIHPISGANTTHHTETIYDPVPPDPSEFSDDPESANNFEESLDVENLDTETDSQSIPTSRAQSDSQLWRPTAKKSGSRARTVSTKTASQLKRKPRGKTRLPQARPSTQNVREAEPIANPQTKLRSDNSMLSVSNIGKVLGSRASQKLVPINSPIKVPVTKRKPKKPTHILEGNAFSSPSTQTTESAKAQQSRTTPTNHRRGQQTKKLRQSTPRPAKRGTRRLLGRLSLSSDSVAMRVESSPSDLPQLPPGHESNQVLTSGSGPRHWFTVSDLSSDPMNEDNLKASPPDVRMTADHEREHENTTEAAEEADKSLPAYDYTNEESISFSFSPNTVRRRVALIDDPLTSDSDIAMNET